MAESILCQRILRRLPITCQDPAVWRAQWQDENDKWKYRYLCDKCKNDMEAGAKAIGVKIEFKEIDQSTPFA